MATIFVQLYFLFWTEHYESKLVESIFVYLLHLLPPFLFFSLFIVVSIFWLEVASVKSHLIHATIIMGNKGKGRGCIGNLVKFVMPTENGRVFLQYLVLVSLLIPRQNSCLVQKVFFHLLSILLIEHAFPKKGTFSLPIHSPHRTCLKKVFFPHPN